MIEYTVKVYEDGSNSWHLDSKLHREDGPAVEYSDGSKYWFLNGRRHREDGPAIERSEGTKHWYLDGKLHREDGPAIERSDGSKYWFLSGYRLTEEEFNLKMNAVKELTINEIEALLGHKVKVIKGSQENVG